MKAADHDAVADQPVGWLATTVTLYDALEKDIRGRYLPSTKRSARFRFASRIPTPSGRRQDGRRAPDPGQHAGDGAERRQPDASRRH